MKFLCDENVPKGLVVFLSALPDSDTQNILELKLKGLPDEKVREIADEDDRILVTFDKDFVLPPLAKGKTIVLHFPRMKPKEIIPYFAACINNLKTKKLETDFVIRLSKDAMVVEK